jgi:hypothetical protein
MPTHNLLPSCGELNEIYAPLRQAGGNIIKQGETACCYAKSEKSEAEAKPNRGIDVAAIEEAVHQAAIELREHDSGVGIEFLRKLPIGDERNGV